MEQNTPKKIEFVFFDAGRGHRPPTGDPDAKPAMGRQAIEHTGVNGRDRYCQKVCGNPYRGYLQPTAQEWVDAGKPAAFESATGDDLDVPPLDRKVTGKALAGVEAGYGGFVRAAQ